MFFSFFFFNNAAKPHSPFEERNELCALRVTEKRKFGIIIKKK